MGREQLGHVLDLGVDGVAGRGVHVQPAQGVVLDVEAQAQLCSQTHPDGRPHEPGPPLLLLSVLDLDHGPVGDGVHAGAVSQFVLQGVEVPHHLVCGGLGLHVPVAVGDGDPDVVDAGQGTRGASLRG